MADDRSSNFKPDGWHTVTARIVADGSRELAQFLQQVFNAVGEYRSDAPTVLTVGDSHIMISDAELRPATSSFFYVYVRDADETYHRAIEAGAESLEPPADMHYGDRRAMVRDQWGNVWQIATHRAKSLE